MMKPVGDKNFLCNVCQRGFTRIDHLKRHHLRHSGVKPYSCAFCNEAFARCDNLRDHYTECPQRGDNPIPETGQRGRRRHACESCTSMKLRCDGQSPCGSCIKRKLPCNNLVKQIKPKIEGPKTAEPSPIRNEEFESSDRGSISFLLNDGTDSFTEKFCLPPRIDRARSMQYVQNELEEPSNATINPTTELFSDFDDMTSFEESFMSLITGPLSEPPNSLTDNFTGKFTSYPMGLPGQVPKADMAGPSFYESESPFSTALVQAILERISLVTMDPKTQEEVSSELHFLLTTQRIHKFVSLYFQSWHRNCKIIHAPSFGLEQVTLPLLASVVFMGATYSKEEYEASVARRMLDFAELYVFSTDLFSPEHEISLAFAGRPTTDAERLDWHSLQNLQAALLMAITQYWAGSKVSRNRMMEARFNDIVHVARRTNLTRCRHLPEDQLHETLWIQKECHVRTINLIALLDTAFCFYSNFPCRLTLTELKCELPCEDSIFAVKNPFAQPNFRFSRGTSIYEAFQDLFQNEQTASNSGKDHPHTHSHDFQRHRQNSSIGASLTVTDLFLLIHLLHSFISSHMALQAPLMHFNYTDSYSHPSPASQRPLESADPVIASIHNALSRWRALWIDLRARTSSDEWAAMGFYKTAYSFWQMANWLLTKKHSVEVMMHMEVKCEDKLEKLKVLLQDE